MTAVDCLTEIGVTQGYGYDEGERYLPDGEVPRGQMATFVARALTAAGVELPAPSDQGFADVDDGDVHAEAIRQLAEIDVVEGVSADRYAPGQLVDRAQMATFLVGAYAHQAGVEREDVRAGATPFADLNADSPHNRSIAGAYQLGITAGVSDDAYAPDATVKRERMASFVARTLDAMTARQTVLDQDQGAFEHTVFTELTDGGRCFDVTAGDHWEYRCDPATDETLQLYQIPLEDDVTVVAGLVTSNVTSVVIEHNGETTGADLVETRSDGVLAWGSAVLGENIDTVVAYEDDTEVAREDPNT